MRCPNCGAAHGLVFRQCYFGHWEHQLDDDGHISVERTTLATTPLPGAHVVYCGVCGHFWQNEEVTVSKDRHVTLCDAHKPAKPREQKT